MSASVKGLTELASAIKQLGYQSSTKAIENIPKLAVAMRQLMSELSKAPSVSRNIIDMTNALAKLSRTGGAAGTAAKASQAHLADLVQVLLRLPRSRFPLRLQSEKCMQRIGLYPEDLGYLEMPLTYHPH